MTTFPFTGIFNIQNKKNGLYLSVNKFGELIMTEKNLGIMSEWSWKLTIDSMGALVPVTYPDFTLDVYTKVK